MVLPVPFIVIAKSPGRALLTSWQAACLRISSPVLLEHPHPRPSEYSTLPTTWAPSITVVQHRLGTVAVISSEPAECYKPDKPFPSRLFLLFYHRVTSRPYVVTFQDQLCLWQIKSWHFPEASPDPFCGYPSLYHNPRINCLGSLPTELMRCFLAWLWHSNSKLVFSGFIFQAGFFSVPCSTIKVPTHASCIVFI